MKILHVTPSYLPAVRYGGPIWSVHGLSKAQAALGHHVEVYTTNVDGAGNSDVPIEEIVEINGVKVTYFPSSRLRRLFYAPRMGKALRRNVGRFDVVHTHSVYLWPTTAAAKAARKARVPYIISPRGMLWREVIHERSKWIKSAWIAAFEKRNIESANAIHVTADLEASKILELGLKIPRAINLPNAVDAAPELNETKISPDVHFALQAGDYILSLGRLSWKKNNIALIRAMTSVPKVNLIIAGNEEDDHASDLRAEIDKLGLTSRVHLIARQVSGNDKEALFIKSLGFVLPSLSENMGNTVLEAMIRKCPVIVSREAGVMEIVAKHECGLVSDPAPQGLAAAINQLLDDSSAALKMATRGQQAAQKTYSWANIAEAMCAAYPQFSAE